MNVKEWLDTLDIGLVTYDIYKEEFKYYGELPSIPRDYFLPIAGFDIINDDTCKLVLDSLKAENKRIDKKYTKEEQESESREYNTDCFFISLNAGQVFDFLFGKKKYIWDKNGFNAPASIQACLDAFLFDFWNYLREEITFDELKASAKELNDAYEKYCIGGDLK